MIAGRSTGVPDASRRRRASFGPWPAPGGHSGGTLDAPVAGPYRKVARRQVGSDSADYRSAVDEMSLATRLTDCGYNVTVSSPDIIASHGPDVLRIELTAPLKTDKFLALQNLLTAEWR